MSMTKIIMSIHYSPMQQLREYIDNNRDLVVPVCGGSSLKDSDDEWIKKNVIMDDCRKDNISHLNKQLNELTNIYLIWKNLSLLDGHTANIGNEHYRRFFSRESIKDIDTVDGIIANPISLGVAGFPCTLEKQYELCHYKEDFDILKQTIIDEGLMDEEAWNVWTKVNYLYAPCNCFVLKREVFNMFCKDLFKVALKLPNLIDVTGRDDYQKRACSFLSERFTSYWFFAQAARGRCRWKIVDLEYHPDWKGTNSIDSRGCFNGIFKGDQSLQKVADFIKSR